jgi:hypothetical protein
VWRAWEDAARDAMAAVNVPAEPESPDGLLHDRIHPTSGRLIAAAPIMPDKPAADPYGLGEGWAEHSGYWVHLSGAQVRPWDIRGRPEWMWWKADEDTRPAVREPSTTAREAARLALGEPAADPHGLCVDTNALREAWDFTVNGGATTREGVIAMLLEYDRQRNGGE